MKRTNESGMALISAILVVALMSALLVGFVSMVIADQNSGLHNRDQTTAYAAAHAGLEQLTSDLGELFATNFRPTSAQVNALTTTPPVLPGISFVSPGGTTGYAINFVSVNGYPQMEATPRTISSGPYQGLQGSVTPYTIEVTARTATGAEVRMRRTMQTVLIPAFQFGIFSENDLSFFAGPNFNFGGRVHTNSYLFLAHSNGATLTMADRVTAVSEVIRTNLSNGWSTSTNYTGTVNVLRAPSTYRALARNEGSLIGTIGSAENEPKWTNLSVGTYNGNIRNGRTGARRLDLPLVQMGAQPVDLIRRPVANSAEDVNNAAVFGQRYFKRASLRILLSDTAADLLSLPSVTPTAPVRLADLRPVTNYGGNPPAWYPIDSTHAPVASAGGTVGAAYTSTNGYWRATYQPLIDGYIKIEVQLTDMTTWVDVTSEILGLGFTGRNLVGNTTMPTFNTISGGSACSDPSSNAIIRIQRLIDTKASCGNGSTNPQDYIPNVLYDPREGDLRDSNATSLSTVYIGGVMHYIELDVRNVARWFSGAIGSGTYGPNAENSDGGYVVYFSDRRTNQRISGLETAEYGFEDIVNRSSTTSIPPDGAMETGEDLNGNGALDIYGETPILPANLRSSVPIGSTSRPWTLIAARDARVNPPILFRRALKIVNGAQSGSSVLTLLPTGVGLTIVSENPAYVQGNYNTSTAGTFGSTQTDHRPSAVIADAVTMLSNNWNDIRSFRSPHDPDNLSGQGGRPSSTTWYRMGIVSGKGLSFQQPTAFSCYQDFGTDGGAHNFLRFIEDWGGTSLNYRGSIISFYTSRQGVGTYKCCTNVYQPPTRGYNFDVEFLQLNLLPPKSPAFRDVNTLTFRQILRPNQ